MWKKHIHQTANSAVAIFFYKSISGSFEWRSERNVISNLKYNNNNLRNNCLDNFHNSEKYSKVYIENIYYYSLLELKFMFRQPYHMLWRQHNGIRCNGILFVWCEIVLCILLFFQSMQNILLNRHLETKYTQMKY